MSKISSSTVIFCFGGMTIASMPPVASLPPDSYPTTRKIKVSICRQDGVPTIVVRMIGQLLMDFIDFSNIRYN
jgi:hypothetical protein